MHVYEKLLTFWKYYCVGESESESEEDSNKEEKKKKHKNSTEKKLRKTCHKKKRLAL